MLAAVTMALSLAHALELPGKLRLGKEQYLAVQPIYYPGFTIGGNRFFQTGRGNAPCDWVAARDQWERSHLLRALAATLGLFLLTLAVAL
jgi:hypothetical protein